MTGGRVTEIWLENRRGGITLGIDEHSPRLSWVSDLGGAEWDLCFDRHDGTRETASAARSNLTEWPFTPLRSRDGGQLRIKAADATMWSDPVLVEAGIRDDWQVDFVSPSTTAPHHLRPAYQLRAEFDLNRHQIHVADISRARVYATAHGVYELELNGAPVSDERLAPGWTSYRNRLRYQTYDITTGLRAGQNAVGVWLADGWYRGHIGFDGGIWDFFGSDVALLLQLEVTTTAGEVHLIDVTDTWTWDTSPIRGTGLYEGETFNGWAYEPDWSTPGFDARLWRRPTILPRSTFPAAIEAPTGPPVREIETIPFLAAERTPSGRIRLDFGQNISGVLRIRPTGAVGHTIRLHHAEVIENGELGIRPLRGATSVDTYVCGSDQREQWSPRFTIHGFRYAEIENWPGDILPGDIEAVVIHTDMERTGWFSSSHPGLNQLHSNVVWSMRDNFVDLPTDCPQRDERMGWTGDIQVFAPTALYLYAAEGTLTGWVRDLAAEQWPDGHVPQFVPWVECGFPNFPTAAWGDAAVIVPWSIYQHTGDPRILEDQYDSMRAWVDLVTRLTGGTGLWDSGFQLGDWLDPAAPPESPGDSQTDRYLVATAYHVKTSRLLARTARILDRQDDAAHYDQVASHATAAFQNEFISPTGRIVSDTAAAIAISLVFELMPTEDAARRAGHRLIELVVRSRFRITTGFVGTPIICDALVIAGDSDSAYHLLLQEHLPSWLYPVTMGATTIWERWDSMLPDGSINPGDMTSFNHYALGAVADFLHRSVAGLAPASPGWRSLTFKPLPGGGLSFAEARHDTPLGTAMSSWRRDEEAFHLTVIVPVGATGEIVLPGTESSEMVGPGTHTFSIPFRSPEQDPRPVAAARHRPVAAP